VVVATVDEAPLQFLQLVADPFRWQILRHLGRSDRRVGELAQLVGKAQNLVSYHLGALRSAQLVSARQSSADRRDTYYRLNLARCGALLVTAGSALHPALQFVPLHPQPPQTVTRRKPRVLFLCTGNSARSQMAEALLVNRSGGTIEARSAGSHPKALHPNAVRMMAERGIDISARPTKHLSRFVRTRFDRVITLCDKVKEICPEFPGRSP
jgi:DNA-binding transcriptional ArsR family regulator